MEVDVEVEVVVDGRRAGRPWLWWMKASMKGVWGPLRVTRFGVGWCVVSPGVVVEEEVMVEEVAVEEEMAVEEVVEEVVVEEVVVVGVITCCM